MIYCTTITSAEVLFTWQSFHCIEAETCILDYHRCFDKSCRLQTFLFANIVDLSLQFGQIYTFRFHFVWEIISQYSHKLFQFLSIARHKRYSFCHCNEVNGYNIVCIHLLELLFYVNLIFLSYYVRNSK